MASNALIRVEDRRTRHSQPEPDDSILPLPRRNTLTVMYKGPGLSMLQLATYGGKLLETIATPFFNGPKSPNAWIVKFFGSDVQRQTSLENLYHHNRKHPTPTTIQKQHSALRNHCHKLLRYARPESETVDTQLVTFKILVAVIPRYPGIRILFYDDKDFNKTPLTHPDLWKRDQDCGKEWDYYRDFVVFCISESPLAVLVESQLPSELGRLPESLRGNMALTESLLGYCRSGPEFDLPRLCAIRYLAGILELRGFWQQGEVNPRGIYNVLSDICAAILQLIQDTEIDVPEENRLLFPWLSAALNALDILACAALDGVLLLDSINCLPHCPPQLATIVSLLTRDQETQTRFPRASTPASLVNSMLEHALPPNTEATEVNPPSPEDEQEVIIPPSLGNDSSEADEADSLADADASPDPLPKSGFLAANEENSENDNRIGSEDVDEADSLADADASPDPPPKSEFIAANEENSENDNRIGSEHDSIGSEDASGGRPTMSGADGDTTEESGLPPPSESSVEPSASASPSEPPQSRETERRASDEVGLDQSGNLVSKHVGSSKGNEQVSEDDETLLRIRRTASPDASLSRGAQKDEAAPEASQTLVGASNDNVRARGRVASTPRTGSRPFDEHHLAPRPRDWRNDYSPRSGIGAVSTAPYLPLPNDNSSSPFAVPGVYTPPGSPYIPPPPTPTSYTPPSFPSTYWPAPSNDNDHFSSPYSRKLTLNPLLMFNASRPNIAFDLRRAPPETSLFRAQGPRPGTLSFGNAGNSSFMGAGGGKTVRFNATVESYTENPWVTGNTDNSWNTDNPWFTAQQWQTQNSGMAQLAVTPSAMHMRLMHPRLPWYVDVQSANGITVYDVLRTLFEKLKRQIVAQDFYNEELDARDREIVTRAFQDRFSMNGWESAREEKLKGVKQVDFLGEEFIFVGLERRNDMWEIKTTKK